MTTSIILAQILGLYLIIMSVAMLVNKRYYQDAMIVMLQNSGVMFLTAIITLLLGVLLIVFHNIWVLDWRIVITILAWLGLIKGIVRMFFPKVIVKWSNSIQNDRVYCISLGICTALGVYLAYKGFF
jgi:hypothetical protein